MAGPLAGVRVVEIAGLGPVPYAGMLLAELGADVLRVGPADGLPIASAGIPEELLPVLEILPLQQFAWRLALDRGIDPDRPRGLVKITNTW